MADVFLSYKRDDRAAIDAVAKQLRALGLTVWFDARLTAGDSFNAEIDREARAASAMLICWSPAAVQSRWVTSEAMIGFDEDKLVACRVAGPDTFSLPAPFNTIHAPDLRSWLMQPSETQTNWRTVLQKIGELCARQDIEDWGALETDGPVDDLRAWLNEHRESPLITAVHAELVSRQVLEEERVKHQLALREAYAREEAERAAREDAEAKVLAEARQRKTSEQEAEERRLRGPIPTLIGSILAVPIFTVTYIIVSTLAYAGLILFQMLNLDPRGGGLTYGAQLFAAALSGHFGVRMARALLDSWLKAWNGWPAFLTLIVSWTALFYFSITRAHMLDHWWSVALTALQCLVSIGTALFFIAFKVDSD